MRSIKSRLLLKGYKNKQSIITILLALVAMAGQAQTTVKGHVINERGENIEYVSIGIEEDSVGVISDAQGNFTLTIPEGRDSDSLRDLRQWVRTDCNTERQGNRTGRGCSRQEEQAAHAVGQVVDKDKHGRLRG